MPATAATSRATFIIPSERSSPKNEASGRFSASMTISSPEGSSGGIGIN